MKHKEDKNLFELDRARIIAVFGESYKVLQNGEELIVKLPGKFYNNDPQATDFPCVGDWVYLKDNIIIQIEDRKNQLSRKVAGKKIKEQIFASNIDYAFIVSSLNKEFNIKRIERYYVLVKSSGIIPIVVLTKKDMCPNYSDYRDDIKNFNKDLCIITTSSVIGDGIEELRGMLSEEKTGIFIGSSGVGKSTLINTLFDNELQVTKEVRKDDKGRHATTHRELFYLPSGGCVIDTPGIREIQFWSGNFDSELFGDIVTVSYNCKFNDCQHKSEPFCAVKKAIEEGIIETSKLKSYQRYKRELYIANLKNNKGEGIRNKSRVKKQSKSERYSKKR